MSRLASYLIVDSDVAQALMPAASRFVSTRSFIVKSHVVRDTSNRILYRIPTALAANPSRDRKGAFSVAASDLPAHGFRELWSLR